MRMSWVVVARTTRFLRHGSYCAGPWRSTVVAKSGPEDLLDETAEVSATEGTFGPRGGAKSGPEPAKSFIT